MNDAAKVLLMAVCDWTPPADVGCFTVVATPAGDLITVVATTCCVTSHVRLDPAAGLASVDPALKVFCAHHLAELARAHKEAHLVRTLEAAGCAFAAAIERAGDPLAN